MKEASMWRCMCVCGCVCMCMCVYVCKHGGSVQHAGRAAQIRAILEPHFSFYVTLPYSVKLTSG